MFLELLQWDWPVGADPLTRFLIETGQNLIGGESAGGSKLQEIIGATRKTTQNLLQH